MMTDLRKIAQAMGGEVNGNVASFPTPGHSPKDRGSWASIVPGAPDGILINSANGGDPLAIKDALRAKGVLPSRDKTLRSRDVAAWEYTDADGVTLYRKVRMVLPSGGKSYRFEHPDGRGGWKPKRGDAPQVPYRLPDIIAAEHAAILYMAEGEKQADLLASWGFLATSSKDWRDEFGAFLKGRTIAILPDNDPEGERVAADAKAKVERAGCKAIILNLPGLPPKGDVMDWTGTADDLRAITTAAMQPLAKLLPMLELAAWERTETPSREWALNEWIPARQATYLTGPGSAGKSLLTQQLCTCMALGLPFMGVETRQAVAIYVTCEDDADELHRRQKAICEALGVRLSDLAGKLHLVSLVGAIGNELATFDANGRMMTAEAYRTLKDTALATGAGFLALDNVAHLFAGNENIRNQVAAFCGLLNQLAHDTDAAVLFLGHPNKAGDSFSGSTAWENQVRSRLFMETPKDEHGDILDPDARVLSRGKANYARNGEKLAFRWHKWAFVREADMPPNVAHEIAANVQASAENERFLRCLAKATEEKRATSASKSAANYAPRLFAAMPTGKGISERGFEAAMQRLLHLGTIQNGQRVYQRDNRAWVTGLGLAPTLAPTPAQTLARECTEAPPHREEQVHQPARTHPPISKHISGAAPAGDAAPSHEERRGSTPAPAIFTAEHPNGRRHGGMILAPGESPDDAVPGWE